jgi:hypothetical protein
MKASLKNIPEYGNFKMNSIAQDSLVSGAGSIHDITSEQVLSS